MTVEEIRVQKALAMLEVEEAETAHAAASEHAHELQVATSEAISTALDIARRLPVQVDRLRETLAGIDLDGLSEAQTQAERFLGAAAAARVKLREFQLPGRPVTSGWGK
ncbi:MAG: hypothetical protein JO197_15405 [Acidobacteria bacterium]|nr:hypothetical protein [Acidobacteriota bacterium]MBV9475090.1 hypothetical protein [Acidobacteriota bacterium]